MSLEPKKNTTVSVEVKNSKIANLEHAIVILSITHEERGLLQIFLTSPSGTTKIIPGSTKMKELFIFRN
jgi:subtilisin-like proprotein convertase family protein